MTSKKEIIKEWLRVFIVAIAGIVMGGTMTFILKPTDKGLEATFTIELSKDQIPALVTTEFGEEIIEAPTVEIIDNGAIFDDSQGLGEWFDTSYDLAFYNSVGIGRCLNNSFGAQCVELINQFFWNYAGRAISTCGTGMAKGIMNCDNAKDDFEVLYDATQIQAGDIIVFSGGQYGHVGQAIGPYNNGYVALFGQNQGGSYCEKGGAGTNVVNKSTKDLIGILRPKAYIKVEPVPEPLPISGCIQWHVERGDTMSKIMMECEGTIQYGEIMDAYAKTWYSLVYKPNQSVYDGWHSQSGVGLYAGDDIEHRIK